MTKGVQYQNSYVTHAFIDAQNIYKGVQSDGWSLDWRKFRVYLRDKYHVEKAFILLDICLSIKACIHFYKSVAMF